MAPTAKQLPIYNFHKGDYNEIRQLLSQINWNELLKDIDTNAAWYVFNDKLKSIIQLCVPIEAMNTTKRNVHISIQKFSNFAIRKRLFGESFFSPAVTWTICDTLRREMLLEI